MKDTALRILYQELDADSPDSESSPPSHSGLPERRRKRHGQFLAGKRLAEEALAQAGLKETHTLVRRDERWEVQGPGDRALWLSISHSGEWVVCAFSARARVGVDIESLSRPLRDLDEWGEYLDARVHAAILALPEATQSTALMRCWTLLESLGKLRQTLLLQSAGFPLFDENGNISLASWSESYRCYGGEVGSDHFLGLVAPALSADECKRLGLRAFSTIHDLCETGPT